jgi:WhiB family transcriptional regulator, redox-sensing transcriptional regulator
MTMILDRGPTTQWPSQRGDPELWFSELPARLELAKALCGPCPVRQACLAGAIERREPHGVWGGEIFDRGLITACKRPRGRPRSRTGSALGKPSSYGEEQEARAG